MKTGLQDNLKSESIRNLPTREPILVTPNTLVRAAVAKMRQQQLGCAVVVDVQERPLGIFTERSVIDLLLTDPQLDQNTVGDHLDANWAAVNQSEPIERALGLVLNRGMRFLCVTDDEGRVVGLTGQRGLSEYVAEHFPHHVMVQYVGGKPSIAKREGA
jgi:CBS domain-containing protein